LSAFGEARFVVQLPLSTAWRPFVGTSGSVVISQFGETAQRLSIDCGTAWLGW
jgi:hypothetical protein